MNLSNNKPLVISVAVIAILICGFFLFKGFTQKEEGVMDGKSEPIQHMQELGKMMQRNIPNNGGGGGTPPPSGGASGQ